MAAACLSLAANSFRAQEPPAAAAQEPAVRVLKVGTLHPIAGPAIEGGVLVIRGGEILAVGRAGEVEIPAAAEVLDFPQAHAYPGLVDALSTAFADQRLLEDGSTNAGSEVADGLDRFDETSRGLVAAGITTTYVSSRAKTTWRGKGAIVRPRRDGFETLGDERTSTAVSLRLGSADDAHPLARQKEFRSVESSFEGLETYAAQKKKHAEALQQYENEFAKYLDWHRKRGDGDRPRGGRRGAGEQDGGPTRDASGDATARRGRPRRSEAGQDGGDPTGEPPSGRRGGRRRGGAAGADAGNTGTPPAPAADAGSGARPGASDEAPKRPTYPRPFRTDPAKEALLAVRAGELTLRVDARHGDEIEAALRLARELNLPKLVLEHADEAAPLATALRDAGVPVVLCDLEPDGESAIDEVDRARLPAVLADAGVEFCLASGAKRAARHLPLLAAYACGEGLDERAAVAAITLQAARVLGVADRVGSLEPGKLADVIVTSGPLLAPDSRILQVLSGGETQFEEK